MPGPRPALVPSLRIFCKRPSTPCAAELSSVQTVQRFRLVLLLHERPSLAKRRGGRGGRSVRFDKCNAGEVVGRPAISPSKTDPGRGRKAAFSPLDQALIQAMACEVVAETKEPLSRQSLADLVTARPSGRWVRRSAAARSGGCCTKRRSSPGKD